MTRRKIRLAWIGNDTSRKASFKKRRAGLLKKVSELSTLCGVSAFIVIYSPGESDPPTVWPSVEVARQLYERFISVPDIERCKKMVNQEGYLRERATKMAEQLRKQHRKNREKMTCHVMRQVEDGKPLNEFETSELGSVVWVLEEKMKEIKRRIEYYDQTVGIQPPGSLLLPPPMIPMEELLMGDQSWESFFGGIMSNLNNYNNNIVNTNNNSLVLRGIDQGNSVRMQVPEQRLFLGGTSTLGTTSLGSNYNTVQPFYGAGISSSSSSSSGGTGNGLGFQPYVSHQSFGNNINNNNIVISNDQMGLGNFGYFGSRGGSQIIPGGFNDMGLAPQQLNLGGINNNLRGTSTQGMGNITCTSITSVQNPNFGLNVGSGGVNENVGFGLHSSRGSTLGGNNDIGNVTNNSFNQYFAFNGGNNAGVVGQGQENNQGYQSNNGGSSNVSGGDAGKNMPSGLLSGASGGTSTAGSDDAAGLPYDFSKNWHSLLQ
ncbi:MADS-box transcription factor [Parasponia andersonii]|uniref:MADS-box transcription factor n=1 Tax=Parasponia andersonii TaxID=3476 RepID=A0A2P5AZW7_PARAD|nr:MADS-box transcription factor [Parasponia andersonii]